MDMGRRKSAYFDSNGKFIKLSAREASITVVMDLVKDPALPFTETEKKFEKGNAKRENTAKEDTNRKFNNPPLPIFSSYQAPK